MKFSLILSIVALVVSLVSLFVVTRNIYFKWNKKEKHKRLLNE